MFQTKYISFIPHQGLHDYTTSYENEAFGKVDLNLPRKSTKLHCNGTSNFATRALETLVNLRTPRRNLNGESRMITAMKD